MASILDITEEIDKSEREGIKIKYYTMDGKNVELYMCPGDLMIICNVLHDYAKLLAESEGLIPDMSVGQKFTFQAHMRKCKDIQMYIEQQIGYSTEDAIIKCRDKDNKTGKDIGEDALILAAKQRAKEKEKNKHNGDLV